MVWLDTRVLVVHIYQQDVHPRGHILHLWTPSTGTTLLYSYEYDNEMDSIFGLYIEYITEVHSECEITSNICIRYKQLL
jgi:hypothetical protein